MNIDKCRLCKNYSEFFGACMLYVEDVYLGEGDFDTRYCKIENIELEECEFELKYKGNKQLLK